jgi:8-oxo-dGTP pyrophosphatase MutT (NUDIX family)
MHEAEYIRVLDAAGNPDSNFPEDGILRERIYAEQLPHHIVHVMARNEAGEFIFQRRSPNKSYKPNTLVSAGSGHVKAGETLLQAGVRESTEEGGEGFGQHILESADDSRVQILPYEDPERPGFRKFLAVIDVTYDGPLTVTEADDVSGFEKYSTAQILQFKDPVAEFHPETLYILRSIYGLEI